MPVKNIKSGVTSEILKQRQDLPLEAKVAMTRSKVREWYEAHDGDVYVSFSGGKDSTVLADIVKSTYPDVPSVFCDTGLEYPEVKNFALANADVVIKPRYNFKQVIERHGYPFPTKEQADYIHQYKHAKSEKIRDLRWNGRDGKGSYAISKKWRPLVDAPFEVSTKCCDVMKKQPFKKYERSTGRAPLIGTMAVDSKLRKQEYLLHGCNAFDASRPKSTPMGFWTDQDVLRYIKERDLPYASCYGEIAESEDGTLSTSKLSNTGCMFCMFGVAREKAPNRFQRMERDYPKQHSYCIEKLGIGKVLDFAGVPYRDEGEEVD